MSLVPDYGSSDSEEESVVETTNKLPAKSSSVSSSLASLLPAPKKTTASSTSSSTATSTTSPSKSKPVFYVDVPKRLYDDDEDEEEKKNKKPKMARTTGDLADLLPAPKHSANSFLAAAAAKKAATPSISSASSSSSLSASINKQKQATPTPTPKKPVINATPDVDESTVEEETVEDQVDDSVTKHSGPFFRLGSDLTAAPSYPSTTTKVETYQTTEEAVPSSTEPTTADTETVYIEDPNAMYAYGTDPSLYYQYYQQQQEWEEAQNEKLETAEGDLNEAALHQLGGRRAKGAGVQIKTINQQDMLPSDTWRAQALASAPTFASSGPALTASKAQLKKNNIMALAAQAQSLQDKLEEQYAQNRRTKRETQSKYGF
ncbi:mitotic checkpoint regulator, MAD2B-interacting-domain-containing protein [Radiomyces spectabilis]|uniref:mitotic checkpoint regulator, MAD2B-interacting-domain-containing protein n=1 Tax=Radiomyces spectabilis TaxID=64574 RepID=UPI0022201124|nr:mitotic checkpoint regulator, MAD2B-interacting-domain-containing protein [Radiomyces spectabilis]KAI8379450.1 mitotic checkpoint regulator, MAD2B-interacting-domain-containing protein [Radiomyces spectabilis]